MRLVTKALAATLAAGALSTLAVAAPGTAVAQSRPDAPIACCPQ